MESVLVMCDRKDYAIGVELVVEWKDFNVIKLEDYYWIFEGYFLITRGYV